MKKQKIKVTKVPVPTDPPTEVFQVEIVSVDNSVSWSDTFNTPEALKTFLRGVRMATTMLGLTFDMKAYWEFEPGSFVEELP